MSIPLEQFTQLYVQNIRNCLLDEQGSNSMRDSMATTQMQFTTLTDLI